MAGQSEWHRAAAAGDVMQITDRLEAGQDIDARDRFGQTALMVSADRRFELRLPHRPY